MRLTKCFLLFSALFFAGAVQAEYFHIKDYGVAVHVRGSEGVLEVKEVITVQFTQPRRGIYRNIPFRYRFSGEEIKLKIYDVVVENFKYTAYTENNDFVIRIGDPDVYVDGTQTYEISYKVKNAFIFAEKHTEFYWNIIGDAWEVPIEKIHYTVKLDKSLPMTEGDYYIYTGEAGTQGKDATVAYFMDTFTGSSTRVFNPHEAVTLAINLPIDYVRRPGKWEVLWAKYGIANIGIILFLMISGMFYRTWIKYGKDYPIVRMVQYTPPKDLNPAEAGVIIDEKADNIDILSLLPYWAHKGHITMKLVPVNWGKDDHELQKVTNLPADAAPYESIIFDALFEDSDNVLVSSLENKFYSHLQSAKTSLKTHIQQSLGVYYPVSIKMQIYTLVISILVGVVGVVLAFLLQSIVLGLAMILSCIIGLFFANYMLKKNERGVKLYQEVLGFKMFVKAAEKDKIERMLKDDPGYFEKTLPYAMIFGYAKSWSKKFDGLLLEPPKWYVAPHGMYFHGNSFSPAEFGASFDSGIKDIQSTFTSMPASSGGGGGFSGGGSSGGGFGGGGGGSW